jgi:hypothetical protein
MSTKKALKDIRAQLTAQDAEGALQASTSLLKLIGDKDADAPTV